MRELETEAQEVRLSEDSIHAFKGVWKTAHEEGRKQLEIRLDGHDSPC
jgi:hypothetical protein